MASKAAVTPPAFSDVVADSDFQKLDVNGKAQVAERYYQNVVSKDPEFAQLTSDEQSGLRVRLYQSAGLPLRGGTNVTASGEAVPEQAPSQDVNPIEGLGNLAGSVASGVGNAVKTLSNPVELLSNLASQVQQGAGQEAKAFQGNPLQYGLNTLPALALGAVQGGRSLINNASAIPADIANAYSGRKAFEPALQVPNLPQAALDLLQQRPVTAGLGEQAPYLLPMLRGLGASKGLSMLGEAAALGAVNAQGLENRIQNAAFSAGTAAPILPIAKAIQARVSKVQPLRPQVLPETRPMPVPAPIQKAPLPAVAEAPIPAADVAAPVVKAPQERGFVSTMKESPNTAPAVVQGVTGSYQPITNRETLSKAQALIDDNLDEAVRRVREETNPTAETYAIGQDLVRRYQAEGRFEDAIDIVERMAEKATSQGQAIQALSMWNRLTPEGALKYAHRLARRSGGKLDEDLARRITEKAKRLQEEPNGNRRIIDTASLMATIGEAEKVGTLKKISAIQTMGQLLNPKTMIRNIVGNVGFAAAESGSDVLAASIDYVLSKVTGQRTKALPQLGVAGQGFKRGLQAGVRDALQGIDTSAMSATQFDIPKGKVFKNKILQGAEKALNLSLKAPDRAFYMAAYRESVMNQLKAQRVRRITPEMVAKAHHEALYRTFQDENIATQIFTGLKKGLNAGKDFGLGDLILKYPKTPANLLMRATDYSPVGFVKAVYEASKPFIGKSAFDQRKFVETLARAIHGTGSAVGLGYYLGKLGIATGERLEDKDINAAKQLEGDGAYRLNASALLRFTLHGLSPKAAKAQKDDVFISYDWYQPLALPFSMGVNIAQSQGTSGEERAVDALGTTLEALNKGTETLAEQPLLQGMKRLFQGGSVVEGVGEALTSAPASFVPTLLNQANQVVDNTVRETADKNPIQQGINQVKAKVPGLAQTLPERRDVYGQPQGRYQDNSNNPLNVFLNPAFVSRLKSDPVGREVLDIYQQSGETQQALPVVPKKITVAQRGQETRITLTGQQLADYQEFVGKRSKAILDSVVKMPRFQALSPEGKADAMASIVSDVNTAAKYRLFGHEPQKRMSRLAMAVALDRKDIALRFAEMEVVTAMARSFKRTVYQKR